MSSTNKTSLGLNMWEASDKPVRQDFINDNVIIDEKVSKLEQDLSNGNVIINDKIAQLNSNLADLTYPLVYKGEITGDLNRPNIDIGYYIVTMPGTISNAPSEVAQYCVFIQFAGYNTQMILFDGVKTRRRVGAPVPVWTNWV